MTTASYTPATGTSALNNARRMLGGSIDP